MRSNDNDAMRECLAEFLLGLSRDNLTQTVLVDAYSHAWESKGPATAQQLADLERRLVLATAAASAMEPVMTYLEATIRISGPRIGDVIAVVNDIPLRKSDIEKVRATLTALGSADARHPDQFPKSAPILP